MNSVLFVFWNCVYAKNINQSFLCVHGGLKADQHAHLLFRKDATIPVGARTGGTLGHLLEGWQCPGGGKWLTSEEWMCSVGWRGQGGVFVGISRSRGTRAQALAQGIQDAWSMRDERGAERDLGLGCKSLCRRFCFDSVSSSEDHWAVVWHDMACVWWRPSLSGWRKWPRQH